MTTTTQQRRQRQQQREENASNKVFRKDILVEMKMHKNAQQGVQAKIVVQHYVSPQL